MDFSCRTGEDCWINDVYSEELGVDTKHKQMCLLAQKIRFFSVQSTTSIDTSRGNSSSSNIKTSILVVSETTAYSVHAAKCQQLYCVWCARVVAVRIAHGVVVAAINRYSFGFENLQSVTRVWENIIRTYFMWILCEKYIGVFLQLCGRCYFEFKLQYSYEYYEWMHLFHSASPMPQPYTHTHTHQHSIWIGKSSTSAAASDLVPCVCGIGIYTHKHINTHINTSIYTQTHSPQQNPSSGVLKQYRNYCRPYCSRHRRERKTQMSLPIWYRAKPFQ